MYRYEMHLHTSETSPCGKIRGARAARKYKELGYDGIVVTDHYSDRFFLSERGKSHSQKVEAFLAGYREVLREGSRLGLNVFLGMEITFRWSLNDFLVYGLDEEFLFENPSLQKAGLKKFKRLADLKGYAVFQAHPFRLGMTRAKTSLLDGIEVYNGNPRHNSKNDTAAEYATKKGLNVISGSDFHRFEDAGRGGILLPDNPQNNRQLVKMLRQNDLRLIQND